MTDIDVPPNIIELSASTVAQLRPAALVIPKWPEAPLVIELRAIVADGSGSQPARSTFNRSSELVPCGARCLRALPRLSASWHCWRDSARGAVHQAWHVRLGCLDAQRAG